MQDRSSGESQVKYSFFPYLTVPFKLEHMIPQQQLDVLWGWHDTSLQPKLSLVLIQFARHFQNEMAGKHSFTCFYMEVEFCSEND